MRGKPPTVHFINCKRKTLAIYTIHTAISAYSAGKAYENWDEYYTKTEFFKDPFLDSPLQHVPMKQIINHN